MKASSVLLRSLAASLLFSSALAHAATVTGTVTDKTTGKPSAGDTVVLVDVQAGMGEVAKATTDAQGHYALKEPGYYQISGIAYSGTGRIAKVLVSADAGKSWGEAALQGPISPKAYTRFSMPWRWDGQPVVLQSRAWDEAGNSQPLRADFIALRGQTKTVPNSPYAFPNNHYNSLTSWGIDAKGEIKHVYA